MVTQETGFSGFIPTGEGLFSFSNMDEAVGAIEAIESDYERHRRAAREIAAEYFDARTVLPRLLRRDLFSQLTTGGEQSPPREGTEALRYDHWGFAAAAPEWGNAHERGSQASGCVHKMSEARFWNLCKVAQKFYANLGEIEDAKSLDFRDTAEDVDCNAKGRTYARP